MATVFIGQKPSGLMVVKSMRGDYDPLTTPSSAFQAFNFDSEQLQYATIREVRTMNTVNATIANPANVSVGIANLGYQPMVSAYLRWPGGRYEDQGWMKQSNPTGYYSRFYPWSTTTEVGVRAYQTFPGAEFVVAVWNLPADGQAPQWRQQGTPAAGQMLADFSAERIAIAAPGFDVRTASQQQLILGATVNPVQCVAAGVVLASSSAPAVVPIDNPWGGELFCDLQWNTTGVWMRVPYAVRASFDANVSYTFVDQSVVFETTWPDPIAIRYFVFAFSRAGRTQGNFGGWRVVKQNGKERFQVILPGSSETPNINDIAWDSEWMTIPVASWRRWQNTFDFNNWSGSPWLNLGYIPFIKFSHTEATATLPPLGKAICGNGDFRAYGASTPGVRPPNALMSAYTVDPAGVAPIVNQSAGSNGLPTLNPRPLNLYQFATP